MLFGRPNGVGSQQQICSKYVILSFISLVPQNVMELRCLHESLLNIAASHNFRVYPRVSYIFLLTRFLFRSFYKDELDMKVFSVDQREAKRLWVIKILFFADAQVKVQIVILFLKSQFNLILSQTGKRDLFQRAPQLLVLPYVTVNICCSVTIIVLDVFRENSFLNRLVLCL